MNEAEQTIIDAPTAAKLLDAARDARSRSYSPYSNFPVGAALLDAEGRIHLGANIENAAYGISMCAERTALFHAVASGTHAFVAIGVVGPAEAESCTPCGSCRQALNEFAPDLPIIMSDPSAGFVVKRLSALLPDAFGPRNLQEARGDR